MYLDPPMANRASLRSVAPVSPPKFKETSGRRRRSGSNAFGVSPASTVVEHVSSGTQPRGTLRCTFDIPPVMTPDAATVLARIVRALPAHQEGQAT